MIRFKCKHDDGPIYVMYLAGEHTVSMTQMTPHGNIDIGPIQTLPEAEWQSRIDNHRASNLWTECY